MSSRRALLLVGHGAADDPESGAPVREVASRLTRTGVFWEVATAFWNEGPPIREVLEALDADDIFVVPMFLADGYYARQVVPRVTARRTPHARGSRADPLLSTGGLAPDDGPGGSDAGGVAAGDEASLERGGRRRPP